MSTHQTWPRRSFFGLGAGALAAVAVGNQAAHAVPIDAEAQAKRKYLGIVSFNALYKISKAKAEADAERLLNWGRPHIISWQEAGENFHGGVWLRQHGYADDWGSHEGRDPIPVSWRTDRFTQVGASTLAEAPDVGDKVEKRFIRVITLKEKGSGREVVVINTHLPNKCEKDGEWAAKKNGDLKPEARAAQKHLQKLKTMFQEYRGHPYLFMTGDFNYDFTLDKKNGPDDAPFRTFQTLAKSNYQLGRWPGKPGTMDKSVRNIDYIYASNKSLSKLEVVTCDINRKMKSDHHAIKVRFQLTG